MSRTFTTTLALGLLMAGPLALASSDEPAQEKAHQCTQDCEHHAGMAPDFAKLDVNGDGQLEKTELPEGHPMAGHFDMMDKDKDGKVSKAEFDAMHGGHEGHH